MLPDLLTNLSETPLFVGLPRSSVSKWRACKGLFHKGLWVHGEAGAWVCLADERHRLDLHPRLVCAPPTESMPRTEWTERSGGGVPLTHWLAGIGITAVLLPPPQASGGDGSYRQPLGDIRPGGGSKSGRRRRKKPQRGKIITRLEPWSL